MQVCVSLAFVTMSTLDKRGQSVDHPCGTPDVDPGENPPNRVGTTDLDGPVLSDSV